MMDIKTIDEMTVFLFKDESCKKRWIKLVETKYYQDYTAHITMDFARRWGKAMQYQMTNLNKTLNDIAVLCAKEANVDNVVQLSHLKGAIALLSDFWYYCDEFRKWYNNGGYVIIRQYF